MKLFKSLSIALVAILFGSGALFAQVQQQAPQMPDFPTSADVSDNEIEQLVNAIIELGPVQEKTQERIAEAVEAENLSFDRFQQLMMAMQNPQMADQVDVSDEEMATLQTIQPKLMEIQGEAETEMVAKIEENGLTAERYQQIIMGAQQDPELLARVETLLDEREEN
jgi:cytoskeletal protein RodZ